MSDEDIQFNRRGRLGHVELNRPAALNALTVDMCRRFYDQMRAWASDPAIATVAITGAGDRAFCAGGDIRSLWAAPDGDAIKREFFWIEYRLDQFLYRYPKPYVAFTHAVTLGGGVGVSGPARFRVATEKTLWAMPETGIGFFPDVAGSYYLSRCAGEIGTYLGLVGARLKADDLLHANLSTHFSPLASLPALLSALERDTPQTALIGCATAPATESILAAQRVAIDRCFAGNSVEDILAALDRDGGAWTTLTAAELRRKSPLALKVALRLIREGRRLDFDDCLRLEYRLARRFMKSADFREGVRAVVVDKDNTPNWSPADLAGVTPAMVGSFFAPLQGEPELSFDS